LTVLLLVGTLLGCSSATPTDDPGVERLGEFILRHNGDQTTSILGFRHAAANVGSEWMLLELAFSSPPGKRAEIRRQDVFLRTPRGDRVPLATQQEFAEDYGTLQAFMTKADVVRDPMDYFPPSRQDCLVGFYSAPPGASVTFDRVSLNDRRACQGRFFFKVPGGVQNGRWTLAIDLEESKIRIPFTL
jgi:hypothetical protein